MIATLLTIISIVWSSAAGNPPQAQPSGPMINIARIHYTPAQIFGGCGIQINDNWILLAKHEVKIWAPGMIHIRVGEKRLRAKRIVLHPDEKVDLALIELTAPTAPPKQIPLFRGSPEIKSRLWLGGYGKQGPAGKAGAAGKFAAGFNELEAIKNNRGKVVLTKDVADEVLPSRFDSGSPVFIEIGDQWQLLGITVTASNSHNPTHGDRSHHQLIGPEIEWLETTITQ